MRPPSFLERLERFEIPTGEPHGVLRYGLVQAMQFGRESSRSTVKIFAEPLRARE
jgi:hypothetical protein